jgi:hypothetical protein
MITLENVNDYLSNSHDIIGVICAGKQKEDKYFTVLKTINIQLSNGEVVKINKGYKFDGSSSPRLLTPIFPRYGSFIFAALIHDWLYDNKNKEDLSVSMRNIGLKNAKKFADKEMLTWSNVVNRNKIDNYLRYKAVILFGKKEYKD